MNATILVATAAGLLLLAADAPDDATKRDLDKFQGTWKVQKFLKEGEDEADAAAKMSLVIDGNKFSMKTESKTEEATFKLDATKTPPTFDLVPSDKDVKDKNIWGIYQLDGDTLKIAFGLDGAERPTEFVSKPKSKVGLLELKREKK